MHVSKKHVPETYINDNKKVPKHVSMCACKQGVPGGMDKTSGECSLC